MNEKWRGQAELHNTLVYVGENVDKVHELLREVWGTTTGVNVGLNFMGCGLYHVDTLVDLVPDFLEHNRLKVGIIYDEGDKWLKLANEYKRMIKAFHGSMFHTSLTQSKVKAQQVATNLGRNYIGTMSNQAMGSRFDADVTILWGAGPTAQDFFDKVSADPTLTSFVKEKCLNVVCDAAVPEFQKHFGDPHIVGALDIGTIKKPLLENCNPDMFVHHLQTNPAVVEMFPKDKRLVASDNYGVSRHFLSWKPSGYKNVGQLLYRLITSMHKEKVFLVGMDLVSGHLESAKGCLQGDQHGDDVLCRDGELRKAPAHWVQAADTWRDMIGARRDVYNLSSIGQPFGTYSSFSAFEEFVRFTGFRVRPVTKGTTGSLITTQQFDMGVSKLRESFLQLDAEIVENIYPIQAKVLYDELLEATKSQNCDTINEAITIYNQGIRLLRTEVVEEGTQMLNSIQEGLGNEWNPDPSGA